MTTRVESLETVIDSIKEFIEKETGNTTDHNPIDRRDPGNVVFVAFSPTPFIFSGIIKGRRGRGPSNFHAT